MTLFTLLKKAIGAKIDNIVDEASPSTPKSTLAEEKKVVLPPPKWKPAFAWSDDEKRAANHQKIKELTERNKKHRNEVRERMKERRERALTR